MIALIEFVVVGFLFFLMVKLSNPETPEKQISRSQLIRKIASKFWVYFLFPATLVILALNISYNIQDWNSEIKAIIFSSIMLFCGFFIFTAMFMRMRDNI